MKELDNYELSNLVKMPDVKLVVMNYNVDYAAILSRAFREIGCTVDVIEVPHFSADKKFIRRLNEIKSHLRRVSLASPDSITIFCPAYAEQFVSEAHFILSFSGYQPWYDERRMRVMPHVWTVAEPLNSGAVMWTTKPALRVGFMGTAYSSSKLANLLARLPKKLRAWVLQGHYLRSPLAMATFYNFTKAFETLGTFPRFEAIKKIRAQASEYPEMDLDIVERIGFGSSDMEKSAYVEHLLHCTYTICPRGIENFSFRMYEALKFGRVPVIIDTEMVLPKELDWAKLAIIVPYDKLDRLCAYIQEDYLTKTTDEFIARQHLALDTMKRLKTMDWVRDLAAETVLRLQAKSDLAH